MNIASSIRKAFLIVAVLCVFAFFLIVFFLPIKLFKMNFKECMPNE